MIFSWPIFFFLWSPTISFNLFTILFSESWTWKNTPRAQTILSTSIHPRFQQVFHSRILHGLRQKTNYLSVNPNSPPFTFWTIERLNFHDPKHSNINCPLAIGNSVHNIILIRGQQTKPQTYPRISIHKQWFAVS
jgi:hypothetical protein